MSQVEVDKIIPQSGTTLTIGDSGDTITVASGATLTGDLNADNLTSGTVPNARLSGAYTGITQTGTLTSFASTGIDDNATSTAITINSSENVGIGTASPASRLDVRSSDSLTDIRISNEGTGGAKLRLSTGGTSASSTIDFGDDNDGNVGGISYSHSSDAMVFVTNAAERMRILSTGGITFNGDTATSNALNDYEEGTWSATSGGSSIGGGTYRKIGNFVYADLVIQSNSLSITSFSGLPFSMSGANGYSGGFWGRVRYGDILDANGVPYRISISGTNVIFYDNNVSGTDTSVAITTASSGTVRIGLTLIGFTT